MLLDGCREVPVSDRQVNLLFGDGESNGRAAVDKTGDIVDEFRIQRVDGNTVGFVDL
jgi:hypothetical protein